MNKHLNLETFFFFYLGIYIRIQYYKYQYLQLISTFHSAQYQKNKHRKCHWKLYWLLNKQWCFKTLKDFFFFPQQKTTCTWDTHVQYLPVASTKCHVPVSGDKLAEAESNLMAQLDQMYFSSSQFCSAGLKARINKQPEAVQEVVQNNVMLIYAPPHIDSFPIAFFSSADSRKQVKRMTKQRKGSG